MKIFISEGWGDCETCGGYDYHDVSCPDLEFHEYYDGHLHGGPTIEESLISLLKKMGHEVIQDNA